MSHMAPGEGSPVTNPEATPEEIPYEPQQGTGDAEKSEDEVQELQERELAAREDEDPEVVRPKGKTRGKHEK